MKAFMSHTRRSADRLRRALEALEADVRVALMHYAPVPATLHGERREIYPFLGSHLLAEAVDLAGADLVVHGHAHAGSEKGTTPGGVPVRNVAQPVIRSAYRVYCFDREAGVDCGEPAIP
jgi:Icc-related predicted phosphoesterase